jgi:aspartate/methionine/tyrosine aminotransferase
MEIRFSKRIPADLTENELSLRTAELRKTGRPILDLTVSNPTDAGLCANDAELRECFASVSPSRYEPDPRGMRTARELVASWIGADRVDPDSIWLTSGTSEAYGHLFKLLADPGDEVAIPVPSYPLFQHLLDLEGLSARSYHLRYGDRWAIDFESLEGAVNSRTRAIVIVHPNNPTGSFVGVDEMKELVRLCERRGVALIVDEVFLKYAFDGEIGSSFATIESSAPIFVLNGLSKQFGLPQMKLSWIHVNAPHGMKEEISRRLDWIADSYLSVSTPVQLALPGLEKIGNDLHLKITNRIQENVAILKQSIEGKPDVRDVSGEGGWSAILRLPDHVNEENLVRDLLVGEGVQVYPGYFFDLPFSASIVLSLLAPGADFQRALERILSRVRSGL